MNAHFQQMMAGVLLFPVAFCPHRMEHTACVSASLLAMTNAAVTAQNGILCYTILTTQRLNNKVHQ